MPTGLDKLMAKQDFAKEAEKVNQGPKIEIRRREPEHVEEPAAEGKKAEGASSQRYQFVAWLDVAYKKRIALIKAESGKSGKEVMEEALDYLCEKYGVK